MEGATKMEDTQNTLQENVEETTPDKVNSTNNNEAENKSKETESTLEKKYSDKEVDEIIKSKKAKWKAELEKEQNEADKLANMNEKDKADYEKQKLLDKIADYERKENLSKMSDEASSMLIEKGIQASKNILSFVVTEDAEQTSANVKAFVDLINDERQKIKQEFEKKLGSKTPVGGTASNEISHGAKLAEQANKSTQVTGPNPWGKK